MQFIGWSLLWISMVVVVYGKSRCFRTELGYEERNFADGGKRSHLYKRAMSEIKEAFRTAGTPQKNPFSKRNKSISLSRMVLVYVLFKHREEAPMAVKRILGYDIIGEPVSKVDYIVKFNEGLQPTIKLADNDMLENVVHRCEKRPFKMTKWREFFERLKNGSRVAELDKVPAHEESETPDQKESEIPDHKDFEIINPGEEESKLRSHQESETSDHNNSEIINPTKEESEAPDHEESETYDHKDSDNLNFEEPRKPDDEESAETLDYDESSVRSSEVATSATSRLMKAIGHSSAEAHDHEESETSDNQESEAADHEEYQHDIPEPTTSATPNVKKAIGHISAPQDDKNEQFVIYKYNQ